MRFVASGVERNEADLGALVDHAAILTRVTWGQPADTPSNHIEPAVTLVARFGISRD
jgi:hypothetical protein